MSYVKHTWVNNEAITASKMNNIEDGIEEAAQSGGGGALIVNLDTSNNNTLDKTFLEIYTALRGGVPAYIKYVWETAGPSTDYESVVVLHPIIEAHKYDATYVVYAYNVREGQVTGNYYVGSPCVSTFKATSVNGYPVFLGDTSATNVSFVD